MTMDLYELFSLPDVALPKNRTENAPFDRYLGGLFSEYINSLAKLNASDPLSEAVRMSLPQIESLAVGVRESVCEYLKGFPHAAYDKLKQAIAGCEGALSSLMIQVGTNSGMREFERLYRIRIGKLESFSRGDLFHVPFELRNRVSSQRFSIPGLPSLYLSGSLWACWEEMKRPDFHTFQASRFRYHQPASILDFGFRPEYLATLRDSKLLGLEVLSSYAICWPLIAACSIRVYAPEMPFIPEYIVPQLLLQWLGNETALDGLRYFSTRIRQDRYDAWAAMNYVFPVKEQAATGYCPKLQGKFYLSAPCAWSILTSAMFVDIPFSPQPWSIAVNEDRFVAYSDTDFYKCEHKLEGLPCKDVTGRLTM
jgi:hypothetical protein